MEIKHRLSWATYLNFYPCAIGQTEHLKFSRVGRDQCDGQVVTLD